MKISKKRSKEFAIFIGVVVFLIVINVFLEFKTKEKPINYDKLSEEEFDQVLEKEMLDIENKELSEKGERDRMEFYVSKFIKAIEKSQYEDAYNMLYDVFRDKYFPTLTSFERYCKTKLPSMIALEHDNFERNGEVYVLWVTMSNPIAGKESGKEMNFVVKENGINDYVLSFTVFE